MQQARPLRAPAFVLLSGFWLGWTLLLSVWGRPAFALTPIPLLNGPVVDQSGVLSAATRDFLEQELRELKDLSGTQIVVLTIPALEGEDIAQYSIRVVEKWQLGTKETDRGLLVLLSIKDRKVRIEVGQGLEGELTDAYSKRIIDQRMVPLFREGDYDAGVIAGVSAVVSLTDPSFRFGGEGQAVVGSERRVERGPAGLWSLAKHFFPFILFFIVLSVLHSGRGYSRRAYRRGYWGGFGGGFGGGRGGSGGFGGGGGGFSGGGASGEW